MKSNKLPFINTQIKIVFALLDGSKKYQRQLAKEIGREESTVSRAIDYLVRENVVIKEENDIEGGIRNKGIYKAKLCKISYEIDDGKHILYFFKKVLSQKHLKKSDEKDIIKNLQQNKKIKELLENKYYLLIGFSVECFDLMIESNLDLMLTQTKHFHYHLINECIPHVYDEMKEYLKLPESTEDFKIALRYYLGCSPTFFKTLLKNEPFQLVQIYSDIYFNPNNALFIKCYNLSIHDPIFKDFKKAYFNNYFRLLIDTVFSESIHTDKLEGNTLQNTLDYKIDIIDKGSDASLITNLICRIAKNSRYDEEMFLKNESLEEI